VSSPAKRRRPATICAVSNGTEPFPGLNDMMAKLANREKTSNAPHMTPGIQHHALPSQSLSRPPSNATLKPVIPAMMFDETPPPPVPPKPIVIRADQMYDQLPQQQNKWQFTPVQQRRQSMW
jgi:hypothetical protein